MTILETRTFIEEYTEQVPKGVTHYVGKPEGFKTFYMMIEIPEARETHLFHWNTTNKRWTYVNPDDFDLYTLKPIRFVDVEEPSHNVVYSNAIVRKLVRHDLSVYLPEGATHYMGQWNYKPLIVKKVPPSHTYPYELYFSWNTTFKKWIESLPHTEVIKRLKEIIYVDGTVKEEGQR